MKRSCQLYWEPFISMKMTTYYCSLQYINLPLWNINRFTLKPESIFYT